MKIRIVKGSFVIASVLICFANVQAFAGSRTRAILGPIYKCADQFERFRKHQDFKRVYLSHDPVAAFSTLSSNARLRVINELTRNLQLGVWADLSSSYDPLYRGLSALGLHFPSTSSRLLFSIEWTWQLMKEMPFELLSLDIVEAKLIHLIDLFLHLAGQQTDISTNHYNSGKWTVYPEAILKIPELFVFAEHNLKSSTPIRHLVLARTFNNAFHRLILTALGQFEKGTVMRDPIDVRLAALKVLPKIVISSLHGRANQEYTFKFAKLFLTDMISRPGQPEVIVEAVKGCLIEITRKEEQYLNQNKVESDR